MTNDPNNDATPDATFQDGADQSVRLLAAGADDLAVISALSQDAVCKVGRIQYMPRLRRFSFLLYRLRWEDSTAAARLGAGRHAAFERVASALVIDDVTDVKVTGIDQKDRDFVFNILGLAFEAGTDGAGALAIRCSGGATFVFAVEALNVGLTDLTQPWAAGRAPEHPA